MSVDTVAVEGPALVRALLAQEPAAVQAELARATLLVPVSAAGDGHGVVQRGRTTGGRALLWGFTDAEALRAWDRRPLRGAVALRASAVAELADAPDAILALNAAGPGAHLVQARMLAAPLPPDRPTAPAPSSLVDPQTRTSFRRRAHAAHERGIGEAAAGRLERACTELEDAVAGYGELGDRLHGAAAALDLASCLARRGAIEPALITWERAAEVLSGFGEIDLAASSLLEAAEAASAAARPDDAERLSVDALELCVGTDFSHRLVSLWRSLGER